MLFNSFQFFVFLPIAVACYYATPHRFRWITLLLSSYYFYMCWKPAFLVLIVASTVVDYLAGIGLGKYRSPLIRRLLLTASLSLNLGLLFTFKYLDFALTNLEGIIHSIGIGIELPYPELILPVGISFYTFQTLSYTIDVFKRTTETEYHFGRLACYVAFFPQLVAGPIERSSHLLPQFSREARLSADRVGSGLRIIIWGLFKKMCVADLVAIPVATVYGDPARFDGSIVLLATLLFAVQIYCDFSGYSDIAIGVARIMDLDLMTNFRQPYFSRSISEFWQRWHISLSTWFRDYVYIPLGGSRCSTGKWVRNILVTFLVSGLWHGAAWTFVIWGGLHGSYLLAERFLARPTAGFLEAVGLSKYPRFLDGLRILRTFALVTLAWVFFRAQTVSEAVNVLARMFDWSRFNFADLDHLGLATFEMALCFIMPLIVVAVDAIIFFKPQGMMGLWERPVVRSFAYATCVYAIFVFGIFDEVDFIYFQF